MTVVGDTAYIAYGYYEGGLRVVDVHNPLAPTEVGFYATGGKAYDVAVAGGYAYVASGDDGLRIVNVGSPAPPQEVGSFDTGRKPLRHSRLGRLYVCCGRRQRVAGDR